MFKQHVTRTLIVGAIGLAVALGIALASPNIYEGRVEMLVGTGDQPRNAQTVLTAEVEAILQRGLAGGATTERQLLTSQSVFFEAFQAAIQARGQTELRNRWNEFYQMYDVVAARVTTQEPGAGVVLVQARAFDPELAAEIANQIGFVYNDTRRRNSREVVSDALRYVETQMSAAEVDLDRTQERFRLLKEEGAIADFQATQRDKTSIVTQLQQTIQGLESQLAGARAAVSEQRRLLANASAQVPEAEANTRSQVLAALEQQMATLQGDRDRLLGMYLPDHVNVKNVDDSIRSLQRRIDDEQQRSFVETSTTRVANPVRRQIETGLAQSETSAASIQSQLASARESMAATQQEIRELASKEVALTVAARDLGIFEQKYQRLKTMAEELRTRAETGARAAILLNTARADPTPVAPSTLVFAFVGLLTGLCTGLVFSFAWESMRVRVNSSALLAEITGLPVLAATPSLRGPVRGLRPLATGATAPLETFRYLAFSLAPSAGAGRALLFTGVRTAQGSANSALQTSLALAKTGVSVLLVDAELGRQALTRAFSSEGQPGLSNLLTEDAGELAGKEIGVATSQPGLTLLPAGERPLKALSDAPISRIEAALDALRKMAEVVVVSAPPCDVLADASYIARYMDDVLLVVSGASPAHRAVPVAHDLLIRAGAQRVSLILTDAAPNEEPFGARAALARAE